MTPKVHFHTRFGKNMKLVTKQQSPGNTVISHTKLIAKMAIVMPLLSIQAIHAQTALSVDPAAVNQAAIGAAANGVPVIDIVAPNGAGVSHNKFTDYNVGAAGLILNNSNTSVQTQLGGLVSGNAQLGGAPARVILNEVTGSNASRLGGTTEIAGQAAHLIVANPNGITADGVGFVNATRATLVAGHPVLGEDGNVSGFRTDNGRLAVEGSGIDGSGTQQLDLIARSLQVNAEIRAAKLNVVADKGRTTLEGDVIEREEGVTKLQEGVTKLQEGVFVDPVTGEISISNVSISNVSIVSNVSISNVSTTSIDSGPERPAVAIDVSKLGSLQADSIRMLAGSAGVGVNVLGKVIAKDALNVQGGLVNEGTVSGNRVSVSGGLKNLGVESKATAIGVLNVSGGLVNEGTVSGNSVSVSGGLKNLGVESKATAIGVLNVSGGLVNEGTVSGNSVSVSGGLMNLGVESKVAAIDDLKVTGGIMNQGTIRSGVISVTGGLSNSAQGIITSTAKINVTGGTLNQGRIDEDVKPALQDVAAPLIADNSANPSVTPPLPPVLPQPSGTVASSPTASSNSGASKNVTPQPTLASPQPSRNVAPSPNASSNSGASKNVTPLPTLASPQPSRNVAPSPTVSSNSGASQRVTSAAPQVQVIRQSASTPVRVVQVLTQATGQHQQKQVQVAHQPKAAPAPAVQQWTNAQLKAAGVRVPGPWAWIKPFASSTRK
ncbi:MULTISPECIES: filamentous hemagglutinin N-terminal domain-containing protein [Paraburkholderia]|uniref:two-partner secretion domain-containing protein n=1 Tax=Paraburkholderia TaxID=1822464 RepID=UPI00224D189E|nr:MULTISPECIES: filamentous hemagglutinin N-terminal domain-containing protein [Paraburkholderia]MCX4161306.1 filamentous hemagglutinin N-terminal domain-containing protein [Paraburkholderia megapolitana]MDN7156802.1 filamentous hemagglutinin N-terminal domain-containing protein [Paraburkholderia sp. CHISQ3]MDQ6493847.1 filamentous hemagglutinin N-terminal domain-containing protein [Paraburkholderia megapolitana]